MAQRVLGVVVFWALASSVFAGPASAQATSLKVRVTSARPLANELVTVTTSGTTIQISPLYLYYERNAAKCAGRSTEEALRPNAHTFDILFPGAGSFSYTSTFKPLKGGPYRICAYLYLNTDNPGSRAPRSRAATSVVVAVAPGTDTDGDATPDAVDSCPTVPSQLESGCPVFVKPIVKAVRQRVGKGAYRFTVTCNQSCDVTYAAVVAGIKLQPGSASLTGASPRRLTIRLSKVNVRKLRKKLRTRRSSVTCFIRLRALDTPSTGSSSGDAPAPLVTTRSFKIIR